MTKTFMRIREESFEPERDVIFANTLTFKKSLAEHIKKHEK